jgi:hypothetical protein
MISLLDLPNAEARRLLATGVPVFVPVNPVEYHGRPGGHGHRAARGRRALLRAASGAPQSRLTPDGNRLPLLPCEN